MRALFIVADGGHSHLYPLVPLARDLENRGHTVAVAAPPRLSEVAAGLGLQVMPLPTRPATDDPGGLLGHAMTAHPAATPSLRRARAAVSRYLSDATRLAGWVASAARGWGADVLVRESAAWAAWLAGELADLPVVLFDYAPTPPRLMAVLLGDLFAAARAEAGLPPDPALTTIHQWLHLLAGPPGWFPSRSITPVTHILQPPPPLGEAGQVPEWLVELDGSRACVYVTLGSMFHRTPGIFEMIFQAVAGEPLQVVATIGPDADPDRVDGVPSNVRLVGFMPQAAEAAVLTRADAVVCHGGYGSILASLRHGVPIVSIPLGNADDPTRVPGLEALGAGIVVPEHARSAVAVRSALGAVLRDPRYRRSARQAADQMTALPEFSTAAALVERLAAQRRPVLRDAALRDAVLRDAVLRDAAP